MLVDIIRSFQCVVCCTVDKFSRCPVGELDEVCLMRSKDEITAETFEDADEEAGGCGDILGVAEEFLGSGMMTLQVPGNVPEVRKEQHRGDRISRSGVMSDFTVKPIALTCSFV